jgi:hypothetical protein
MIHQEEPAPGRSLGGFELHIVPDICPSGSLMSYRLSVPLALSMPFFRSGMLGFLTRSFKAIDKHASDLASGVSAITTSAQCITGIEGPWCL